MQKDTQEALAECSGSTGYNENWHSADVVCGGFPCQDISNAGKRAGIAGERSGLWAWLCGAIRLVRPKYGIVENVAALLSNGMGRVQGDLAEIGYDTEWNCIPASAVGAEHDRDRVWIIAYPLQQGLQGRSHKGTNGKDAPRFYEGIGLAIGAEVQGLGKLGASRWGGNIYGIPGRMDRIAAIGNAVVPQIPEILGRVILEAHNRW